tara:strand:+ start:83 stop:1291 length:1209 start_codon:yes stop_codon:yes gene_type:complete
MALNDKFRIDELVKKGDRGVRRDESGKIVVRKKDGKEIKPLPKSAKPFGEERIKGKLVKDKLKEDLVYRDDDINPNQETFSGEADINLVKPKYNEEELVKAVDVEVDELVKKRKPQKPRYILYEKYQQKLDEIKDLNQQLQDVTNERDNLLSNVETLEGSVEVLNAQIITLQEQISFQEEEFRKLTEKFGELSLDFQNAVVKGTREGIERVSLTAQSRGLEAQKETLQSQLDSEKEIVKSLQAANETLQQTIETNAQIFEQQIAQANQQVKAAQATAANAANSKKKKIICNELYHQGFIPQLIWDADERYGDMMFDKDPRLVIGYQMWARKVVEFMRRKPQYSPIVNFFVKPWTEWMAHQMGVLPKSNLRGYLTHLVGKQLCYVVYDFNGGDKLYQRYLNSN